MGYELPSLERRWTYVKANEPIQQQQMFTRLYTYRELCRLFEAAGFVQFEGYDARTGQPFTVNSAHLLLAMTKGL